VFEGAGGGRYLDVTTWLAEDTRECYARRTADETISVGWTLTWAATVVPTSGGHRVVSRGPARATTNGAVTGEAVRDFCDQPEQFDPSWAGTTACDGPMPTIARGSLRAVPDRHTGRTTVVLRGPTYGSPPRPCELDVRNDQLAARFTLDERLLARVSAGQAVTIPVGTFRPRPGDDYIATRICSHFPHRYDGILYLYDCRDTLAWKGTVTITRFPS
jgi:hypothetical protein